MRVKKYIVDSMPEALLIIRKELGQDAVILDQKKIKVGGFLGFFTKHKLEVIAAVEPRARKTAPIAIDNKSIPNIIEKSETIATDIQFQSTSKQQMQSNTKTDVKLHNSEANQIIKNNTNEDKMVEEIKDIKNMFMKMMLNSSNDELPDNIKKVYQHLINRDLDEKVVNNLISVLLEKLGSPKHVVDGYLYEILENEIAKEIEKYTSIQNQKNKQQIFAFVGPTGVGKTTTIAKLAAYYVLEKKASVGFITADTYRIAAVDQLRTYANILNIPVEIVITHDDMKKAINKLQELDIILIDTAGRNYKKDMHVTELKSLLSIANPDEIYLVLSMTTKQKDMHEITRCFKDIVISNFIFTKVDETSSYGALLNMIYEHKKSLSILTNGQNVPEDIMFIDPKKVAKLIVGDRYE
jgi:flagellar biosynthesis protein FlhF